MRYALYDVYEAEIPIPPLGELICESDDFAEIIKSGFERIDETGGECNLRVMKEVVNE